MRDVLSDFRHAVRSLAKSPGFTAVAVATLALAIGANTAIFSLIRGILLRPLPFPAAERVVAVEEQNESKGDVSVSAPNFFDWQSQTRVFSAMGAYFTTGLALAEGSEPERLRATVATPGFFPALAVRPELGRTFTEAEAKRGSEHVAVLSHGLWRRRFRSDPGVLGHLLRLDGESYTIVGVMPAGFRYPEEASDLWIPAAFGPNLERQRGAHYLDVVARLAPGIPLDRARTEMAAIAARLAAQHPNTNTGYSASVRPLQEKLVASVRRPLWILFGAVALVALIACANVANLLLARASRRRSELAVRTALGAPRSRLIRESLTESLVLASAGVALALPLAAWAIDLGVLAAPSLPLLAGVSLDGGVLAFTSGLTLLIGFLFGLAPALAASRLSPATALSGVRSVGSDRRSAALRRAFVVAEVGLALLLLTGAGLLLRSLQRLRGVDPGFEAERVLTFDLSLPASRYKDDAAIATFADSLVSSLSGLPGVRSASIVFGLPLTDLSFSSSFRVEGRPVAEAYEPSAQLRVAGRGYFSTLAIPLRRGRFFESTDRAGAPQTVIASESAARKFFPAGDALGQRIRFGARPGTTRIEGEIVGIVGDVHDAGLDAGPIPEFYGCFEQAPVSEFSVVLASSGDPRTLARSARERVAALDPELPVTGLGSLEGVVSRSVARPRFFLRLLAAFAALSLLLASLGLYGVMASTVGQRTREIGVRVALGATRGTVLRRVLGDAARLLLLGAALGLAASAAATRVMAGLLFEVRPTDFLTLTAATVVLSAVGMLAAYLPARRAARLDPVKALRAE